MVPGGGEDQRQRLALSANTDETINMAGECITKPLEPEQERTL